MTSDSTTTINSSSKKVGLNGTPVQTSPLTSKKPAVDPVIKREYDWVLVLLVIHLNLLSIYAIYLVFTKAMYTTIFFTLLLVLVSTLGVTAGAHRLWAHRSYKANKRLRILLMIAYTLVGQGTIYNWVLKHRIHHKYLGTNKDPYNISKGLLYSHFLSNVEKASPQDEEIAKEIDMSDIEQDGVVMFQKKYFWVLFVFVACILPVNAPMEYWGDSTINSVFIAGILFHCIAYHMAWLVNSAILVWGLQPNDKYPSDTNLVFLITKSYWPQYHHLTPWDYQCDEFGCYGSSCTTTFIRIWAAMGWATGLRTIDSAAVKEAVANSLDTGLPIEVCLENAATGAADKLENHYLYSNK
ncbi:acyl-CoA Delta-9 desaturase [Chrysoperla carnea]|uniref:acyl-CoA Delta-9 desaturase n=1 Tax=Chrysoperla carnea TaxID=189513 RepID=UPI001D07D366|nr:acyl-CoA Delta-9 desaturase [Chrysoperla carnea]